MAARAIVVQTWTGPVEVRRLPFMPEDVDVMDDTTVVGHLRQIGLKVPAGTEAQRAARLREFPTQADLDHIATRATPENDGVRPTARVLEVMPSMRSSGVRGSAGAAGSLPR